MITFGTDGWRGIISEDYTFNNVRLVSEAIADYVIDRQEAEKGIVVGYDARFLSRQYAEDCVAVMASKGVKTWLTDAILPTPALTWQVVDHKAAGGVMITASHNPAEYNGLKFKAPYGGSASPEIIRGIEVFVRQLEATGRVFPKIELSGQVQRVEAQATYLEHVKAMLDKEVLAKFRGKIIFDMMHGAAMGYASKLAKEFDLDVIEIRNQYNPSFAGVNPEPIEKNLAVLSKAIIEHKAVVALATDGDGDRIGAMDADGRFISSNQILALLIKYLVEKRGWTGGVALTFTVSELPKRVANKYGLKLYETPVGFKYIAEHMLSEDILLGGEESGGIGIKGYIPERDGILLGFLLIEMVAAYNKTLGQLLDSMMDELGYFYYTREDLHLDMEKKDRLMDKLLNHTPRVIEDMKIISSNCLDGCKLYLEEGWVMFRPSGTEPIVRIYAEVNNPALLKEVMRKAVQYAQNQ